ncbi:XdhC family protein [Brevibacillus marinus]|uniref:XdhC family protein n=1 Tax=Brevibacillus marinus TaxID=2496837 RepID=UPI0013DFBF46|nr:XdhC family protein [Brevibacillus marinus]
MLEIVNGLNRCWEQKQRAVLATIVEVEGSAYRREGARCLILESGEMIGILSGGCVEGDLLEHARNVLESGLPQLIRYDFRTEEDLTWGLGLGCNGALTIWLQPFDPVRRSAQAEALLQAFQQRVVATKRYTVAAVVESSQPEQLPPGTQLVMQEQDEQPHSPRWSGGLQRTSVRGIPCSLFVETVEPQMRLVICGAGADAVPLVRGAKALQWHVTLIDHRERHASWKRFPEADECLVIPRNGYAALPVSDDAYVVAMTHQYELDRMIVQSLLPRSIPYLGVLGARSRIERMLKEIALEGMDLPEAWLKKLHAPIGLDIGAESPQEIALSILAEVACRKNGRSGQPLRLRKGPLHERNSGEMIGPSQQRWIVEQNAGEKGGAFCATVSNR